MVSYIITPFHDTFNNLVASLKRGDLRLVRISTQTVVSVVVCEFTQCLFNSALYF